MRLSTTATLLACTAVQVQAFSDSSPFVLLSTADLPTPPNTAQLQTSAQVLASAKTLLSSCPTRRYFLVSQPNVHAADLRDVGQATTSSGSSGCRMPNLCRAVREATADAEGGKEATTATVFGVAEVIGQVSGRPLEEYIHAVCAEKGRQDAQVERVELKQLPAVGEAWKEEEREVLLGDNDHELGKLLESLDDDYTMIMFSDPSEFKPYTPEFAEPVHIDLKRRSEELDFVAKRKSNSTSNLPLFEKYQFFTPGIFMSFVVLAILLSILAVGLRSIASLDVSYGAFEKEMGPAAQKKQM